MQNAFRRRFGNALQWYQVLEQRMKYEVDTWVQAISSSRRDCTKPRDEVHLSTNTIPPADSPPTSRSASTGDPHPLVQSSTTAAEPVRDEETRRTIIMIGNAEGTASLSRHQPCAPKAFPLPSDDSTRTLDRCAREGRPSPYLIRRCPVCFGTSAAKLDHSRYVMIIFRALAYQ